MMSPHIAKEAFFVTPGEDRKEHASADPVPPQWRNA